MGFNRARTSLGICGILQGQHGVPAPDSTKTCLKNSGLESRFRNWGIKFPV